MRAVTQARLRVIDAVYEADRIHREGRDLPKRQLLDLTQACIDLCGLRGIQVCAEPPELYKKARKGQRESENSQTLGAPEATKGHHGSENLAAPGEDVFA